MYCINCGKALVGAGVFCQSCGARRDTEEAAPAWARQAFAQPQTPRVNAVRIKFPVAAISIIASVLLSIAMQYYIQADYSSIDGKDKYLILNTALNFFSSFGTLIIDIVLLMILLLKKRGSLVTAAICVWAVWPVIIAIIGRLLLFLQWHMNVAAILIQLLVGLVAELPSLLILGLAAYCGKNRPSTKKQIIPKLWFVPGVINVVLFAWSTIVTLPENAKYLSISYISLQILFTLFDVVTVFLLGYWMFYLSSIKRNNTNYSNGGEVLSWGK
ncbi:MAG: hypothetical protein LBJ84_04200 [Oscillospiraceae bacterium]|jgi:NADH:ubiquinone oxidoreductase subunit 3 (subunit A)|nr:hypothetical protein [Oscillospiraceae bacterium]